MYEIKRRGELRVCTLLVFKFGNSMEAWVLVMEEVEIGNSKEAEVLVMEEVDW